MSGLYEGAPVLVKEEPKWDDGADETPAGLFAEHEVKKELGLDPELLQPQHMALALRGSSNESTAGAVTAARSAAAGAEHARPQEAPASPKLENDPDDEETRLKSPMCAQSDSVTLSSNCAPSEKAKSYICDNCGSQFSSKTYIIRHLQRYELHPYMCKFCEKLFTNISALHNHQRAHFTCNICQIDLKSKYFFTRHKRIHSTDICNKNYERRGNLSEHMLTHNRKTHSCDICNQSFSTQRKLNKHVFIYTGSQPRPCQICKNPFHSHPDGKPYACETCSKSLRTPEDQTESEEKFDCFMCRKTYKSLDSLYQHVQRHSAAKHACKVCKKEFTNSKMKQHMVSHSEKKPYYCDVCKKGLATRAYLAEHMFIHTGVKPHRCDVCDKQFRRRQTFNEHMLGHSHPEGTPYACHICSKAWRSRMSLQVHMQSHSGERLVCDVCKKEFTHRSKLIRHIRSHSEAKRYSRKRFSRRNYSSDHLLTHAGIEQHRSDVCDDQFKLPRALNDRKLRRSPHKTSFACDICHETFTTRMSLRAHKRTHSGTNFVCDVCKKSFKEKNSLRVHMKIHLDVKPYSCEVCKKRFLRHRSFADHQLIHTMVKPHLCHVCSRQFRFRQSLRRHLLVHTSVRIRHACDVCNKSYLKPKDLWKHKQAPCKPILVCDVCKKTFWQRTSLIKHMKIHFGKNRQKNAVAMYKSSHYICNKNYERRGNLSEHMLTHNRKTHSCDICNQSFSTQRKLNKHVLIYTGSQPRPCEICKNPFHSHPAGKPYACETCSKSLRAPEDQTESEEKFDCFMCRKTYKSLDSLYQHVQRHSAAKHACKVCKKEFTNSKMKKHMVSHSEKKPYYCDVCKKGFATRAYLAEHMFIHTGVKPHRCDVCDKQFRRRQTFNEHMLGHSHPEGTPYACHICSKAWRSRMSLRVHMQSHSGVRLVCDVCKKEFTHRASLISHIRSHSEAKRSRKRFSRRNYSSDHLLAHAGIEQHRSDVCDDQFMLPRALNDRKLRRSPHKTSFACDICHETFTTRMSLRAHKRTHSGTNFVCDVCKKSFKQKNSLRVHMKIHLDVKPYSCEVCKKRFLRRRNFAEHQLIHTMVKPHLCHVCSRQFRFQQCLRRHLLVHSSVRIRHACDVCNKSYLKPKDLCKHKQAPCKPNFVCDVCKKTFRQRTSLIKHMKIHFGKNRQKNAVAMYKSSHYIVDCGGTKVQLKNDVLSSARQFNKPLKSMDKLNTQHIGIPGEKKQFYLDEHLLPSTKKLYYEARQFAKVNNYKFCWTSNSKVFLRKEEGSQQILIKSEQCLRAVQGQ